MLEKCAYSFRIASFRKNILLSRFVVYTIRFSSRKRFFVLFLFFKSRNLKNRPNIICGRSWHLAEHLHCVFVTEFANKDDRNRRSVFLSTSTVCFPQYIQPYLSFPLLGFWRGEGRGPGCQSLAIFSQSDRHKSYSSRKTGRAAAMCSQIPFHLLMLVCLVCVEEC